MIYSLTVTNSIGESLTIELSNPWASGYAIKNIDGLGTPDMNVNTTPYGIGDGSVLGSIKAEYRLITIILYPLAMPTVETTRQKLYRYFQMKKQVLLTFNTENRLVTIDGYVQNISPNIFENPESISIEIKCVNPYFHKMMKDQTNFYGVVPQFQFPFSAEFEMSGSNDWIKASLPALKNWNQLHYAGGKFIATGFDQEGDFGSRVNKYIVANSTNGIDWSYVNLPDGLNICDFAYGNNIFVLVSMDGRLLYSSDASIWRSTTLPIERPYLIFRTDDRFVVLSDDGSMAYSHNGVNWEKGNDIPKIVDYWELSAFGNGRAVIVAFGETNIAMYSLDNGESWIEIVLPIERTWADLKYMHDMFYLLPKDGLEFLCSRDGINWNVMTTPIEFSSNPSIAYGENKLLITNGQTPIYSSDGGKSWTSTTIPSDYPSSDLVAYGDGKFVSISSRVSESLYLIPPEVVYIKPIEFSSYSLDNRAEINYEGEIEAGLKITIECQSAPGDIVIYNVDTLDYIQIFAERISVVTGSPLGSKDVVEINTEFGEKYVRLLRNGVYYNILGAMNREMTWFTLKQGPNKFTYTTSNEHAAIVMSFAYRDAYSAI